MTEVRDESGRFRKGVSGNPNGRKKGTTGSKHKASKARLETLLMKHGPESITAIKEMAQLALEKGDLNTAFKCHIWIGDKFYQLVIHNEKVQIQELKDKQKEDDEEDHSDEGETFHNVEISFPVFKAV